MTVSNRSKGKRQQAIKEPSKNSQNTDISQPSHRSSEPSEIETISSQFPPPPPQLPLPPKPELPLINTAAATNTAAANASLFAAAAAAADAGNLANWRDAYSRLQRVEGSQHITPTLLPGTGSSIDDDFEIAMSGKLFIDQVQEINAKEAWELEEDTTRPWNIEKAPDTGSQNEGEHVKNSVTPHAVPVADERERGECKNEAEAEADVKKKNKYSGVGDRAGESEAVDEVGETTAKAALNTSHDADKQAEGYENNQGQQGNGKTNVTEAEELKRILGW